MSTFNSENFSSNTSYNLLAKMVALTFGLLSSAILARKLGVELRGELGLILLFPQTLSAIFLNGFFSTITYSIATKKWRSEKYFPLIFGIAIYLTIIALSAGFLFLFIKTDFLQGISTSLIFIGLVTLPLGALNSSFINLLTAKEAFKDLMKISFIIYPCQFAIYLVLLGFFPENLLVALAALILTQVLHTNLSFSQSVKRIGGKVPSFKPQWNLSEYKSSLTFGLNSQLANLAGFLNYRIDKAIIFALLGASHLGIYVIAVALAEKVWLLAGNVSAVLYTATANHKESLGFSNKAARISSIVLLINLVLAVALALIAKPLVALLYSMEYIESASVLLFLLPGIVLFGFTKVTGNFIAGIGKPHLNAAVSIVALVVNVLLNLKLIPIFGLLGAAIATSCSYGLISICSYVIFVRNAEVSWKAPLIPELSDLKSIWSFLKSRMPS